MIRKMSYLTLYLGGVVLVSMISCNKSQRNSQVKSEAGEVQSAITAEITKIGEPIHGYKNSRLLPNVGVDASSDSVRYGVEVVFDLSDTSYNLDDVKIKRKVSRTIRYNMVLGNKIEPRESVIKDAVDDPGVDNIQKLETDGKKVIKVADSPGIIQPLIIEEKGSFPLVMDADFSLTLEVDNKPISKLDYHINVSRLSIEAPNKGELTVMNR